MESNLAHEHLSSYISCHYGGDMSTKIDLNKDQYRPQVSYQYSTLKKKELRI